uniref:Uncharacterized protein n=1 Tax=Heterorhabditis bacteriophora TaxID=37862 RepID=A0A1I7WZ16_HETBA
MSKEIEKKLMAEKVARVRETELLVFWKTGFDLLVNKNKKKKKGTDGILTTANITSVPVPSTASACTEVPKPDKVISARENVQVASVIDSKPRKARQINGFPNREKCDQAVLQNQAKEHIQFTFKALHSLISERETNLLNACQTNSSFDDRGIEQLIALINNFGIGMLNIY